MLCGRTRRTNIAAPGGYAGGDELSGADRGSALNQAALRQAGGHSAAALPVQPGQRPLVNVRKRTSPSELASLGRGAVAPSRRGVPVAHLCAHAFATANTGSTPGTPICNAPGILLSSSWAQDPGAKAGYTQRALTKSAQARRQSATLFSSVFQAEPSASRSATERRSQRQARDLP